MDVIEAHDFGKTWEEIYNHKRISVYRFYINLSGTKQRFCNRAVERLDVMSGNFQFPIFLLPLQ